MPHFRLKENQQKLFWIREKGSRIGTPLEEIKRASNVFGLDFNFMRTIAKIELDFDPKQRTGSYIGLFQLDRHEFETYGSGDIANPRRYMP